MGVIKDNDVSVSEMAGGPFWRNPAEALVAMNEANDNGLAGLGLARGHDPSVGIVYRNNVLALGLESDLDPDLAVDLGQAVPPDLDPPGGRNPGQDLHPVNVPVHGHDRSDGFQLL